MSDLLSSNCALEDESRSVVALLAYVAQNEHLEDEDFRKGTYPLIEGILAEMVSSIIHHTEKAILTFFRYELDALLEYEELLYAGAGNPQMQSDGIFQAHDGAFRQLLHDLRQQMGHLSEDSEIRKQLQTMINKNRPQIDHWASVIKELEKIRDFRLAITEKMVV